MGAPPPSASGPARRPITSRADALARAHGIADAVDRAWQASHYRSGDYAIPVSVLAALALRTPPDDAQDRARVARRLRAADNDQLLAFLRATWAMYVEVRPDLAHRVTVLAEPWVDGTPDPAILDVARRIVRAALDAGLHELLAAARYEVDLFGPLLMVLRTKSARAARGQFYTPPDIAVVLARLGGRAPQPGERVVEPTAGTGGLLRAVAMNVRDAGGDPRSLYWVAVDTDALALAALAVNAVIWDLGPHVLIALGDVLADDDWQDRALAERAETLTLIRDARAARSLLNFLRRLDSGDDHEVP
jgi:hypothetical protein